MFWATGELTTNGMRARRLHEAHGHRLGVLDLQPRHALTVVSIPRPDGWNEIVAFADGKGDKPSATVIDRAMAQYLDGIRFRNGVVRWSYLASLGLKSAP
jgi:hypothetical protein